MGKLHELLAVEPNLRGAANTFIEEAKGFFNKPERTNGFVKTLRMLDENRVSENETSVLKITSTVTEKTKYVFAGLAKWIDAIFQKESANQTAKADIIVGDLLIKDVPATALLNLEKRLTEVRALLLLAPTTNPSVDWVADPNEGPERFRSNTPTIRHKTEKKMEPVVLSPATDKHPAQVKEITVDRVVGSWTDILYTGAWTPQKKSDVLGRCDGLIAAVKGARARANEVEVPNRVIANQLLSYVLGESIT